MTTAAKKPAARKRTKKADAPAPFVHDALAIRTVNGDDTAHGGFQWPAKIGEVVICPDWDPRPRCGGGFHALLDGIGEWCLTDREGAAIWQVVGVIRDECVAIDEGKVKFPRCVLLYRGDRAGALKLILPKMIAAIKASSTAKITASRNEHAAATGYRGHAAATGDSGHAAATGDSAIAASLGAFGAATAAKGGWIVLAHYDTDKWPYVLTRVERFKVGQDGVEPGKTYRLNADGAPEEVRL